MHGARVLVEFVSSAVGGRDIPLVLSPTYRPHFRVGDGEHLGVTFIEEGRIPVACGEVVEARVLFAYSPSVEYKALQVGTQFSVLEGARIVGVGIVVEVFQHAPAL
ncbi:hypothetical protein GCM10025771_13670 [Niveibacterium umoris]|uniref:Translation elongation factor EF-Tu-like GTPase n=1 Tax=Niveibacterium umoris TaxID=1193620 RepID=A0A840BXB6_9RHOO|nr:translation elongation factor EF-Tu-like GTPase [Niveibacterium umoris]